MKDRILLIAVSCACAAGAWAFWHVLGRDALSVLTGATLVVLVVDNHRLRREAKASRARLD